MNNMMTWAEIAKLVWVRSGLCSDKTLKKIVSNYYYGDNEFMPDELAKAIGNHPKVSADTLATMCRYADPYVSATVAFQVLSAPVKDDEVQERMYTYISENWGAWSLLDWLKVSKAFVANETISAELREKMGELKKPIIPGEEEL